MHEGEGGHARYGPLRFAQGDIALGLAYAGLGRTADAVREARRAMELVPLASDTPAATAFMGGAVEVFARAGETGAALSRRTAMSP